MTKYSKLYTSTTNPDPITHKCSAVLLGDYKKDGITLTKVIHTKSEKSERIAAAEAIVWAENLDIECNCEPNQLLQKGGIEK